MLFRSPEAYYVVKELPTPTPLPEEAPPEEEPVETGTPLTLFIKNNPVISGVIGGVMLLIIILNIVLMVRIHNIKSAAAIRAKKLQTKKK